ncbi:MAG: hypothetical protein IJO32_02785 [Bacilli bacterium]|nr:hypothetical protein [Bacilli bacterium]
MTNSINNTLNKHSLTPIKYTIKNSVTIVETDKGCFVFKKKKDNRNNVNNLYEYLESRSFSFYPKLIENDDRDEYDIYEYINEVDTPKEQKALDIINIISLLHNKTTYYKEATEDNYKEIYENIKKELDYLYNYHTDLITIVEHSIYMSPKEYLFARNISKIYSCLMFCNNELDKWLELTKNKHKQRVVTLHNNLELNHLVRNTDPYLISWDKSIKDIPIYDFYNFYQNHYLDLDFNELFKNYDNKYPLLEEEKMLLFILLSIPKKIEFSDNELESCKQIRKQLDYIYKTENLISEYYKTSYISE